MEKPANGRVAVVTGGSRGLGQVLVRRLLDDGWRVATLSRFANSFIKDTLAEQADDFFWAAVDLTQPQTLQDFITDVTRHFGRIDLLINNAAALHQQLFLTMPLKRISELVTVNLVAPIMLAHAGARAMNLDGTGGIIINVSSINAIRGYRGVAVYSATKAGLDGFTRSLARELGAFNIRVNSVVPGFFESDMTAEVTMANREKIVRNTPLRRVGHIDEVVGAVMFLISSGSSFVTGQTIVVDGGITC